MIWFSQPKEGDIVLCDLAGPLCFQGDYLAKEVQHRWLRFVIPSWKRLFVILDCLQILTTNHHRSSKSSKWQLILIETRYCRRIVAKFGDIFFCDVAFAILLSAMVYVSIRKSAQYVTKTLKSWALPPGGTSESKCRRPTCHPRHWSLHDGHVLQVSFKVVRYWTQESIFPRFNSIRASPIYGYWKGEDGKLQLVCYKKRETVEECLDFWGLLEPEIIL